MSQTNFKDALTKIHELAELLGLDYRLLVNRISEVEKVNNDFNDVHLLKNELRDILKSSTLKAGCQLSDQLSNAVKAEFLLDSEISGQQGDDDARSTCLSGSTDSNDCGNTHNLGFSNACLPQLTPLLHSAWHTEYDKQLGQLFIQLFYNCLALKSFDINNLGNAQLGTFNLIRYISNSDGLAFIKAPQLKEVNATRYLYKAWKNKSHSHRGLFFYRLYLRLQFGDLAKAYQMWQPLAFSDNYPSGLLKKNQKDYEQVTLGAPSDIAFPTSRVRVEIEWDAIEEGRERETAELVKTVSESVLPARLIPSMSIYSEGEAKEYKTGSSIHSSGNEKINEDLLHHSSDIKKEINSLSALADTRIDISKSDKIHHSSDIKKEINSLSALADTRIDARATEKIRHKSMLSSKNTTFSSSFSLLKDKNTKDVLKGQENLSAKTSLMSCGFSILMEAA